MTCPQNYCYNTYIYIKTSFTNIGKRVLPVLKLIYMIKVYVISRYIIEWYYDNGLSTIFIKMSITSKITFYNYESKVYP